MSAFIRTAKGDLLNASTIAKLHVIRDVSNVQFIYADQHEIGASQEKGDVRRLLNTLAARIASQDGAFSIQAGIIHRLHFGEDQNSLENVGYPI